MVLFLLLSGTALSQQPGPEPTAAPKFPTLPPPSIGARPPDGTGMRFALHTGWNLVSFPFAQLESVRGLQYALLRPRNRSTSVVDPTVQAREVDTHFGYWAYANHDSVMEATGAGALSDPVHLEPGWNLVGCPNPNPLALTQLVTLGDNTKTLAYEKTYGGVEGQVQPQPLLPGTTFQPTGCYWVYAYHLGELDWQPASAPQATSVSRAPFVGQVATKQSVPIAGAQVTVTSPSGTFKAVTDTTGHFTVPNTGPGPVQVNIAARNFQPVQAQVGVNGVIAQVKLGRRFCALCAYMYSYDYGKSHYRPVEIWMYETNNYAHRYFNSYSYHVDSYRTDAYFKPFPLGVAYTIEVIWRDQFHDEQTMYKYGVANKSRTDVYFYNSWSYFP
jgi:hypothetical protein